MPEVIASTSELNPIEHRIAGAVRDLSTALRDVLGSLPGSPRRAVEVQRALGIKKDLANRVVRASEMPDPLASALVMPGPSPLRELLAAARACGTPEPCIERAERTVAEFERLIRDEIGDRVTFDGVVGSFLPETREKRELFLKQSVYRGMAQIKGACANAMMDTVFIWPADDATRLDAVWLSGWFGFQCVRPNATMHFRSTHASTTAAPNTLSLEGDSIDDPRDLVLGAFSSISPEDIQIETRGLTTHYVVSNEHVGRRSATDIVLATYHKACMPRADEDANRKYRGASMEISTATKLAVFDVFLHEDVFPGVDPELRVYDTTIHGLADRNDPLRDCDVLDVLETVLPLGRGTSGIRVSELPNYSDMIHTVFQRRGLDPAAFRGYRCRSRYPVYGSQFAFCFKQDRAAQS